MSRTHPETRPAPVIAISVNAKDYSSWVTGSGGTVRLLTPEHDPSLDGVYGLVLTGGEDVDPTRYGQPNRYARRINQERDELELHLIRTALLQDLPILAICRGMQLLVVALGGTLHQDLPQEFAIDAASREHVLHRGPDHSDTKHPIEIDANTLLADIVQRNSFVVNSHHHQGVRTLAGGLSASAHSSDGLIEAVENPRKSFLLGVQWHPERWPDESSTAIMATFLAACAERGESQ